MKSVYNPIEDRINEKGHTVPLGSDIKDWQFNFVKYNHPRGKIFQYEDAVGEALMDTFEFLQDLSKADVEKVLEGQKKKAFACQHCSKSFDVAIALKSHSRTHEKDLAVDESVVPKAQGQPVDGAVPGIGVVTKQPVNSAEVFDETNSPEFYGTGFTETKSQG